MPSILTKVFVLFCVLGLTVLIAFARGKSSKRKPRSASKNLRDAYKVGHDSDSSLSAAQAGDTFYADSDPYLERRTSQSTLRLEEVDTEQKDAYRFTNGESTVSFGSLRPGRRATSGSTSTRVKTIFHRKQNREGDITERLSRVNLDLVERWLDDCRSHEGCKCSYNRDVPLPTRMIYVGEVGNQQHVRLVESRGQSGRYAALTYCWGNSGLNYKSNVLNFRQHKRRIPWKSLPKTVKDAIGVTQLLGIPYLWVDALCILQNVTVRRLWGNKTLKGDWEAEAGKMSEVYQNAAITIAALDTEDCSDGFLYHLPPATRRHAVNTNQAAVISKGTSMTELAALLDRHVFGSGLENYMRRSPLYQRGWCLQELVLSQRLLFFARKGLIWLCKQRLIDEEGSTNIDPSLRPNMDSAVVRLPKSFAPYETWWSWIEDYASRELKFQTDRPAAIRGITDYFSDCTRDEPCLGLWRSQLPRELLWFSKDLGARASLDYDVPTWSWFSVKGGVSGPFDWTKGNFVANAEVIAFQKPRWKGVPMTSSLISSHLLLRGLMWPVWIADRESKSDAETDFEDNPEDEALMFIAKETGMQKKWWKNRRADNLTWKDPASLSLSLQKVSHIRYFCGSCIFDCEEEYERHKYDKLFCFELGMSGPDEPHPIKSTHFLVLAPIPGEPSSYHRLGVGTDAAFEGRLEILDASRQTIDLR